MSEEIDRYWLEQAAQFDEHYSRATSSPLSIFVKRFLNERLRKISSLLKIRKGDRALDVGCGSGFYLQDLIERGSSAVGLDYSHAMLHLSRQRLNQASLAPVVLIQGNASQLPLQGAQQDLILAIGLLDYVNRPSDVLLEFRRVLKPKGRLLLTSPKSPSPFSFLRTSWGKFLRRTLLHLPPVLTVLTREEMERLLQGAGFAIENMDVVQQTMWLVEAKKTGTA